MYPVEILEMLDAPLDEWNCLSISLLRNPKRKKKKKKNWEISGERFKKLERPSDIFPTRPLDISIARGQRRSAQNA